MELTRIDGITDTNKLRGIMANAKGVSDEHYFRSFCLTSAPLGHIEGFS